MNQQKILEGLTSAQAEAVTHFEGPMLVVAGAGSGKTRVVTSRIAWLIAHGVHPGSILAMTFTNKAAGEMKQRVQSMTGEAPRWVGTFHSLCARFLRYDIESLAEGRGRNFTIYDTDDQQAVLKKIFKEQRLDDKRFKARSVSSAISRAKCDLISPVDFGDGSWYEEKVGEIYKEYEQRLRAANALDFDDLLLVASRMLEQVPGLKEEYRRRFRFLLVDEYQDTNRAQYRLLRLLCSDENNIHATGDPDQSIYSWRGADYRNIMDFQRDFPGANVVRLERNYRSTGSILSAANQLIRHNSDRIDKNLYTEAGQGEAVSVVAVDGDRDEAQWIAQRAARLAGSGKKLSDMAVFYRTNAQSRVLEEALLSAGIPYQIVGGVRFYERKEIKDLLAHLKLRVNPRDEISLARVAGCRPTGVGDKTLEHIFAQAVQLGRGAMEFVCAADFEQTFGGRMSAKLKAFRKWCCELMAIPTESPSDCVQRIISHSGLVEHISSNHKDPAWEDRLENISALHNRAAEFTAANPGSDLAVFLEDVALVADVDNYDMAADGIVMMTLHSAKGLEFPVVYLAGLEKGLLPHQNSSGNVSNEEEERRLFYVGITRAREKLFILHAGRRMINGRLESTVPSPFLRELPREELEHLDLTLMGSSHGMADEFDVFGDGMDDEDDFGPADPFFSDEEPPSSFKPRQREREIGTATFKSGDHVEHPSFGRGRVLSCSKNQALVQFFEGRTRMLALSQAKLVRV